MTFIQKNKKKIIFFTLLLLALCAGLFTWLQARVIHSPDDIEMAVYPTRFSLKDTLHYKDMTAFATMRRWEFGDGNVALSDSGIYRYKIPGFYQVKLVINDQLFKIVNIQVMDTVVTEKIEDSLTKIEAPEVAMQFENVIFRATSKTAKIFSWKFGETGSIDAKDPMTIYAYKEPGDYIVSLYTDATAYPLLKKIKILPSFKVMNDSVSLNDAYKEIDDDFKFHLQQIADGKNFNEHYNYLLKKYLCNNEGAVIKINGSKMNDFNTYCLGLQFDKKEIIQTVKVGFDDKQNCVTKAEVQQGK